MLSATHFLHMFWCREHFYHLCPSPTVLIPLLTVKVNKGPRHPEWDLYPPLSFSPSGPCYNLPSSLLYLKHMVSHVPFVFSEPESKPFACKHSVLAFETVWHTRTFKNLQGSIRTSIWGQSQSVGNCLERGGPFKQEITFTIVQTFPLFLSSAPANYISS